MPLLFHGTQNAFSSFTDKERGCGYEANSALGVWLTTRPQRAVAYAPEGEVLRVEIPKMRLAVLTDRRTALWGAPDLNPDDGEIAFPMFEGARDALMALGYGGVWCDQPDTDLEGALCVFDPGHLRILDRMDARSPAVAGLVADFSGLILDPGPDVGAVLRAFRTTEELNSPFSG